MVAGSVRMPVAVSALLIGSLWSAQAARADDTGGIPVPCNVGALEAIFVPHDAGGSFDLASHCTYVLTHPLPPDDDGLFVLNGNHSTIERSSAPGTPPFTIIKVTGDDGVLITNNVNFRNGTVAIENDVDLYVNGGTFSGNGTAILNVTDASVTGAKFIKNTGSAIRTGGQISITNCVFAHNSGQDGAAILDEDSVSVSGSVFRFNSASRRGGAILGDNELHISDSRFTANTAGVAGGAIWNNDDRTNLTGSTLRRNTAPLGGAIYNLSAVKLINTRITANIAAQAGGGIYNDPGEPTSVTLTKSAVTANTPDNCAPAGTVVGCKG